MHPKTKLGLGLLLPAIAAAGFWMWWLGGGAVPLWFGALLGLWIAWLVVLAVRDYRRGVRDRV